MPRHMRLTAAQYAACWGERIGEEQSALAEMVEAEQAKKAERDAIAAEKAAAAAAAAAAKGGAPSDDQLSESGRTRFRSSAVPYADLKRITDLETQLVQERSKREELEKAIALARSR